MSENQKQSIVLGFNNKECWQILKKTGISRVAKESVKALNNLLTRRAREIANKAVTLATEKGREEVQEEDITQAVRMASAIPSYEIGKEAPVVHYVWFISSGGTCLLSRSYSGLEFPDTIFSGLLTGILDLMSEVTGRMIERFSTDDLTIHIRRIGEITVAVICDSEQSYAIDELTDLLALRFANVYNVEIQQEIVDTSIFDDFTPVLDALVAGVGLKIPKESLKIIKSSASLTDRQLEETVDAVALREEMRRAQETIQDLAVFKREESSEMESRFYDSPDVAEIKAVLRQATQDIREEINENGDDELTEMMVEDVSQEEVLMEISKDFPEITTQKIAAPKEDKKPAKKPRKKGRKRKRRRK
ncbi:MAG: histone-like protein [Candidatus Thorarchaeota archaeon]